MGAMAVCLYISCTDVTNVPCTVSIYLLTIPTLYSWCTDAHPTLHDYSIRIIWCNILCMGELGDMAVRQNIDCTNLNWCNQCSMHCFNQFGCHLHPVQLMYRRTANFKRSVNMYFGIAWSYGWTPVHQLYKSGLMSPMFHAMFQLIW